MTIGSLAVATLVGLPVSGWIALLLVLTIGAGALLERRDYQRIPSSSV
jgi:hypothetical protein